MDPKVKDAMSPKDMMIPKNREMSVNEKYFVKRASIVESGEEEELNDYLNDNFNLIDKIHNDEFYPLRNKFRILKIEDGGLEKAEAEKFFLKTLPAGNPRDPIINAYVDEDYIGKKWGDDYQSQIKRRKEQLSEYLQNKQAVVQSIHLNIFGDRKPNDGGNIGYSKYVNGKIRDAFEKSGKILKTDKTYYLLVIHFKNNGNFYMALSLSVAVTDPKNKDIIKSATNHNEFIGKNTEIAIHEVYRLIIDYDYNAIVTDKYYDGVAAAPNYSKNFIGYHVGSQVTTRILDPNPPNSLDELYKEAVADAREKERPSRLKSPPPERGGGIGGKKTSSKKEVLGKMRCIYKIPGDRKEYVKYKGKLITLKDYKMLNKKPRKVADKKPRKVSDKKPRKVSDKKAKRPKKRST